MKKYGFFISGIFWVSAVFAAPVLDIDFSAAEGFSDGLPIDGNQGFNAQNQWVAGDVTGVGYATTGGGWQRARNLADFSLEIGDAVQIETILRLSAASWPNTDVYSAGFAVNTEHSGGATPSIGSKIHSNGDGSYWFGSADAAQRIDVPAAASNDWIKFTQTITRSSVASQFVGTVSASNLTTGADLGATSSAWNQTTADGSWGGTMNASFRGISSSGVTMDLDRWVVSTIDAAPPAVSNAVMAVIDLTRKRSIGGVKALDRETWFGVYHETGYGRGNFTEGPTTMSYDEWINEEGRMWPSRGTVNFESMAEDPARPSYIDPSEFANLNSLFDYRYAWAKTKAPGHKSVFSGEGHGKYPAYMCWDPALTHNIKTVSNNVAHAEAVVNTLAQLESRNGLMPKWFEVQNESSIQNNYGWHWDSDAWDKLSEFHSTVADAVHASAYSNVVKVAGPTDAYPFRDDKDGDFSQYLGSNKKFIQLAGGKMDAYAIHTYEQMTTNSNGNSSFDDQFTVPEIWHLGRLPAFVDLWENDHKIIHGGTLPFVFSEYGLLNNRNPQGDRNAYYQLRSCNGILLSMLDRPDVVDKMSAFLMSQAPYNWNQKRVFFASDDGGATRYKTSYFEYLRFWHDLEGDYLFSDSGSQHLVMHAFLANSDSTLFVVMKNNYNEIFSVDVQAQLPAGASITSAQIQRLYYNGVDDVARDPFAPVADLQQVAIAPDETVMLKIQLAAMPALLTWEEDNHYGDRTLVPLTAAVPEPFVFELPPQRVEAHTAGRISISLYSFDGFSNPLTEVAVNGVVITNIPDVSYTAGAVRSWKQISVPVPAGLLVKGSNTVSVTSADGGSLKKITSLRLTTESALGDADSDTIPDWWETENSLNPFVNDADNHNDADGISNGDEYIAGTDPNNTASYLYVTPADNPGGAGYRVAFPTVTNRTYAVEVKDTLNAGLWADLTNGIAGVNDVLEIQDQQSSTQRYYRIRVEVQ